MNSMKEYTVKRIRCQYNIDAACGTTTATVTLGCCVIAGKYRCKLYPARKGRGPRRLA